MSQSNRDNAALKKPNLRIVQAEDLDTQGSSNRGRSALVQQFIKMSEQIEADIQRILDM